LVALELRPIFQALAQLTLEVALDMEFLAVLLFLLLAVRVGVAPQLQMQLQTLGVEAVRTVVLAVQAS
jgi:hypothetical protein